MAHDIIMPALGMAQETGIITAWKKRPGDAVKAGDVVMEIETDKTTVEIEAGHDGYLAKVLADVGVPVPVGQVVAIISADAADIDTSAPKMNPPAEAPKAKAPPPAPAAPSAAPAPIVAKPAPAERLALPRSGDGRILASPKAKREARERGIDLGRLIRLGVPEPIRSADLAKAGTAAASGAGTSLMRVTIKRAPFERFVAWLASDADLEVSGTVVWAAFASGSLRRATGLGNDTALAVDASGFAEEETATLLNPDLSGLRGLKGEASTDAPALTLLDLTDTPLSEYRPAGARALPHLTIANGPAGDYLDIVLEFDPAEMRPISALEFLKDLAERAHNPLRHLL
jgi:pyruvate/2-oxoglutarate dehydrogenase complex dihydrolipoamide acyltransferase (E2) component